MDLMRRLARLETSFDTAGSVLTRQPDSIMSTETITRDGNNAALESLAEELHSISLVDLTDSQFKTVLEASRVYRKALNPASDVSFRSSAVRSHVWTVLSDISLSDISAISVLSLPILPDEIVYSQHYTFSRTASENLDTATSVSRPRYIDLHPPVVNLRTPYGYPADRRWMLQPPPKAGVMTGKERASRRRLVKVAQTFGGVRNRSREYARIGRIGGFRPKVQ
jgi:hypothetical protein